MGMGYAGYQVYVMEWNDIRAIVLMEAAVFEERLKAADLNMDDFCRAMKWDDWDEDDQTILDAWDKVDEAFTKATAVEKTGLELEPDYHDPDEGSRYDGVEYGFFTVEGVHQLTAAGKKYEEMIDRRNYVEFG